MGDAAAALSQVGLNSAAALVSGILSASEDTMAKAWVDAQLRLLISAELR